VFSDAVAAVWASLRSARLGAVAGSPSTRLECRTPSCSARSRVIALTERKCSFSSMPYALSNAAQVLLGCALVRAFSAARCNRAAFLVGVLVSVAIAMLRAAASRACSPGLRLADRTLGLATAPGGIAEMCITAKVLQLGVPLVTAAHVTRVVVLITTTGPTYRSVALWRERFRRK
jgi:uncharacterized membrane protein AbrB (regulator of aidB expression)